MQKYNWAQGKIDDITKTDQLTRHLEQNLISAESRTERRKRERTEKKTAMRTTKVKA